MVNGVSVHKPEQRKCAWIRQSSPGLLCTMAACRHLANAIAKEWCFVKGFNAFGPDAVLACALIVEEAMMTHQQ